MRLPSQVVLPKVIEEEVQWVTEEEVPLAMEVVRRVVVVVEVVPSMVDTVVVVVPVLVALPVTKWPGDHRGVVGTKEQWVVEAWTSVVDAYGNPHPLEIE